MDTPTKLKDLPHAPTRGEIYIMYKEMPYRKIKNRLNAIVQAFCEKAGEIFNPNDKNIDRLVFVEFVQTYGLPKGYKDNQNIFNQSSFN